MPQMLVHHKVKDFRKWKSIFDSAEMLRKINGQKNCQIFRNIEDANDITILFEWADINKAIKYSNSEDLRRGMKEAGVLDEPNIFVLPEDME